MTVAFVTNFCPHYRVRTFELIARELDAELFFFSKGDEWYWPRGQEVRHGDFPHRYLRGFSVAGTRITPTLPLHLLQNEYSAIVKCVNGRFALPATYAVARRKRIPFVLWTGIWHRIETPAHRLFFPFTRYIYRHADAVVAYGEHVKSYLTGEGVDAERIFVAPHATDDRVYGRSVSVDETEDVRKRLDLPRDRQIVLYLGRLEKAKGVLALLDAFLQAETRDAVLLLVGSGREKEAISRRIDRAGAHERARLTGAVAPDEVPVYHALASVLVLPSITTPRFKEPWGLVVNEAFHQGTPVITSDAVGAAAGGLVEDDMTGLVVPEGDSQALRGGLERILADAPLRRRLGAAARSRIAEWTNERMVQGFVDAIATAQRRRAGGQPSDPSTSRG